MATPAPALHSHDHENCGVEHIEVETSVADAGTWAKALNIKIPENEVTKIYDGIAGELASQVRLPGFRPGRVPRNVVIKRYKKDIERQARGELIQSALHCAIDKENLDTVGTPDLEVVMDLEINRGKPIEFELKIEVRPEFEVGEYKGLKVEQEEVEILDGEVEEALKSLQQRSAEQVDAPEDSEVIERDAVKGEVRWLKDGEVVHKDDDEALLVMEGKTLGVHAEVSDEWLMGAKVGETKKVDDVEVKDHFPVEEHRGSKLSLEFEIKAIRRAVEPEINDALAKKAGCESLEDLKQKISDEIRENLRKQVKDKMRDDLVSQVLEKTPFDLPERLLSNHQDQLKQREMQMLAYMGLAKDEIEKRQGELDERVLEAAEKQLREFFMVSAICKKEDLKVEEDEVDEEVVKRARQQGVRAVEMFERLEESGGLDDIRSELLIKKGIDFIEENAEIMIVPRKKEEEKDEKASKEAEEEKAAEKEEAKAE